VADTYNHAVRLVFRAEDGAWRVETIAGGSARPPRAPRSRAPRPASARAEVCPCVCARARQTGPATWMAAGGLPSSTTRPESPSGPAASWPSPTSTTPPCASCSAFVRPLHPAPRIAHRAVRSAAAVCEGCGGGQSAAPGARGAGASAPSLAGRARMRRRARPCLPAPPSPPPTHTHKACPPLHGRLGRSAASAPALSKRGRADPPPRQGGERGYVDGPLQSARLNRPHGVCWDRCA
jgi:hypothetical protein